MDRCLSEQVAIGIVRNETVGSNGSNLDVDSADSTMNLSPGSGTPTSSTHGSSNHGNNATTSFNLVKLNGLLRVPQVLDDPSPDNCYHINEYIVAAESCAFIAKVVKSSTY